MPYILTDEASEVVPVALDGLTTYTDRQSAHAECTPGLRVKYVPTSLEWANWSAREIARFDDGTYTRTPWAQFDEYPAHFAHLAIDSEGMIAYTADDEAGYLSRKTRVRPGRYLEKFYAHVDLAVRAQWIIDCRARDGHVDLARTPDEAETVYRNAVGFRSCMGPDSHVTFRTHPARVYGGPDLAVVYLGPMDRALARSVVWPEKKRHSTVYGDPKLLAVLEKAGYSRGEIEGAHIRAIKHHRGGYVMPYVDGIDGAEPVNVNGTDLIRLGSGYLATRNQTGRADDMGTCAQCNGECDSDDTYCRSCADDRFECDHCGTECFDTDHSPYCEDCNDQRCNCELCNEDTWAETFSTLSRRGYEMTVCEDCADNSDSCAFSCVHCDSSESEARYRLSVQRARRANGLALVLCNDCDTAGILVCADCGGGYEPTDTAVERCQSCEDTLSAQTVLAMI